MKKYCWWLLLVLAIICTGCATSQLIDITLRVLDNINFSIKKNEKIAIIGETVSGKSILLLALLRLLPSGAEVLGKIIFKNKNFLFATIWIMSLDTSSSTSIQ